MNKDLESGGYVVTCPYCEKEFSVCLEDLCDDIEKARAKLINAWMEINNE